MKITIAAFIAIPLLGQGQSNFIPIQPCRIADTRNPTGPFGGPMLVGAASRSFVIPQSACEWRSPLVSIVRLGLSRVRALRHNRSCIQPIRQS